MKPTIGRIVHYRLPDRYEGDDRWRPALVVNVFDGTSRANLTVFLDGLNDARDVRDANLIESVGTLRDGLFLSVGSAAEGENPGDWRWPPRVTNTHTDEIRAAMASKDPGLAALTLASSPAGDAGASSEPAPTS